MLEVLYVAEPAHASFLHRNDEACASDEREH